MVGREVRPLDFKSRAAEATRAAASPSASASCAGPDGTASADSSESLRLDGLVVRDPGGVDPRSTSA